MKYIYVALGLLFCALGAVGVFLPILPTVPFLLLASLCFAKGSGRFHNWFKSTGLYKNHLESFEKNRSMTLKTKLCILLPVSAMLLLSFFMMKSIYGRAAVAIVMAAKYYYFIFRIKTLPSAAPDNARQNL